MKSQLSQCSVKSTWWFEEEVEGKRGLSPLKKYISFTMGLNTVTFVICTDLIIMER